MPLPRAGNAQEQEYLDRLYDEYCKIMLHNITRNIGPEALGLLNDVPGKISKVAHDFATAMLNERNKK